MQSRIEKINESALASMKKHRIEDTPENRFAYLQGLYDGAEREEDGFDKTFNQAALTMELMRLEHHLLFAKMRR